MTSNAIAASTEPLAPGQEEKLIEVHPRDIAMKAILQSRDKMSPNKVRDYECAWRNDKSFPPLLVTPNHGADWDEPPYLLLDGWHRLQALLNVKEHIEDTPLKKGELSNVKVWVRVVQTPENASPYLLRWLAGKENLTNGLPLNNKDVRELFRAYVRSRQHRKGKSFKSYREIAQDIGLKPHQTIARWMQQDFPGVASVMSKKGKEDVDNGAKGTGNRLVGMPVLEGRNIKLICAEVLDLAKLSEEPQRRDIKQHIETLLKQMIVDAPCKALTRRPDDF